MHVWLTTIDKFGWNHSQIWWDQHLIPQYEYMKGYSISHICCTNALDICFQRIGLEPPKMKRNSYEKATFMPEKKFQQFDLLTEETKALVRKLYANDYDLCKLYCANDELDLAGHQLQRLCKQ